MVWRIIMRWVVEMALRTGMGCVLAFTLVMQVPMVAYADGVVCGGEDLIGSSGLPVQASDIELAGHVAYVLSAESGLYIFDVSGAEPSLIGQYSDDTGVDTYRSIQVDGDRLYLDYRAQPSGEYRRVLDASDPSQLVVIATHEEAEFERAGVVRDDIFYSLEFYGLNVFDMSNPAEPVLLGRYEAFDFANQFCIDGDRAYVHDVTDTGGLMRVLDLSDPTFSDPSSVELGTFGVPNTSIHDMHIEQGLLYLVYQIDGVRIFDVSDLSDAMELGRYEQIGFNRAIDVVGSTMYIASGASGVEIVDTSNPTEPVLIGSSMTPGNTTDLVIRGEVGFFSSYDKGLQIISVEDPSTPLIGTFFVADEGEYASPVKLGFRDAVVFAASYSDGLQIIDFSVPSAPELLGVFREGDDVIDIHIDGDLAYIALDSREQEQAGLYILDVSTPGSPGVVGFFGVDSLLDMEVREGIVFMLTYDTQFHIIDAVDPTNPHLRSSIVPGMSCGSISAQGDVVYAADSVPGAGLVVIDVHDLDAPTIVSTYGALPGGWAQTVVADGQHVYVTTVETSDHDPDTGTGHPGGVHVLECSDLSNPALVSTFEMRIYDRQPRVRDGVLTLAGFLSGMTMIDVSDPEQLRVIGSFYPGPDTRDVLIENDVAYVANSLGRGAIRAIDLSHDCGGCNVDMNGDGELNFFDVSAFLVAYLGEETVADLNGDGAYNFFDVAAFIAQFNAGCP